MIHLKNYRKSLIIFFKYNGLHINNSNNPILQKNAKINYNLEKVSMKITFFTITND